MSGTIVVKVNDGLDDVTIDPIASGVCAWDGKTKIRESSNDIFSDNARGHYDTALIQLNRIKKSLQANGEFMSQFNSTEEFVEYMVFEALVRLASPVTGEYYGSMAKLSQQLGFKSGLIKTTLQTLDDKGMIELYAPINRNTVANRMKPLLKIVDTDRCDYNDAVIKQLRLVS